MKTQVFQKQITELDWSRPSRSSKRFFQGLYNISSQGNLTFGQKLEIIRIYSQYAAMESRMTWTTLKAIKNSELFYLEKIEGILDTWETPWLTAISQGFIYTGNNPVLQTAGKLMK